MSVFHECTDTQRGQKWPQDPREQWAVHIECGKST